MKGSRLSGGPLAVRAAGFLLLLAAVPAGAQSAGLVADPASREAPGPEARSDADPVAEARWLLEAGLPVSAARELARALSDGRAEGREAVLLAARAHAAYRAWPAVVRLLDGQPWLDEAGEARGLLARAHLAMERPGLALEEYERSPELEAGLHAALGRAAALSRLSRHGEAAETLLAAAARHPGVAPWLRLDALREVALAADTARAAPLAAALLRDPAVPADSVRGELAAAAFRAGDTRRGVALARAIAGPVRAGLDGRWTAPALLAAGDTAGAAEALRRSLRSGDAPPEAGTLLLALEPGWRSLREAGDEDLRAGRRERGKSRLERALGLAPPGEGAALAARLAAARVADGEHAGALATLEPWLEREGAAPETRAALWMEAYRAAAGLGRERAADEALARAAGAGAGVASLASFLLADRRHDRGDRAGAREAYRSTISNFPRDRLAELSLIRLGTLDFLEGRYHEAADWFISYRRRFPGGEWYHGALYWQARAREAGGDPAAARALYRETLGHSPVGYYAHRAAARLDVDPWSDIDLRNPPVPAPTAAQRRLLARMDTLRSLGWTHRARAELRVASAPGPREHGARLAFALALNEAGWTSEGVSRAWAVHRATGRWTVPLLRAVHPLPYAEALRRAAVAQGLDPAFVAAVARRESLFDREILSRVGARGLMQLMPATADAVARRAGFAEFHQDQLDVPEVNLLLGTLYLADMLERFAGSRVAALVAYNAGPHRWIRWRDLPEAAVEEELFIERIPFRETREYVRAVLALESIYRRLYGESL